MTRTSLMVRASRPPKYMARRNNRCQLCGRPRAYYRKFHICRICLRKLASEGFIPGMRKASW